MPSYFLSGTLKFLLLLFGPDDYVSLDDFVFTSEGHPLRKSKPTRQDDDNKNDLPLCVLQYRPPVPMPWKLLSLGLVIAIIVAVVVFVVSKTARNVLFIWNADKRKIQ
jgi:hypothetical protein